MCLSYSKSSRFAIGYNRQLLLLETIVSAQFKMSGNAFKLYNFWERQGFPVATNFPVRLKSVSLLFG